MPFVCVSDLNRLIFFPKPDHPCKNLDPQFVPTYVYIYITLYKKMVSPHNCNTFTTFFGLFGGCEFGQ